MVEKQLTVPWAEISAFLHFFLDGNNFGSFLIRHVKDDNNSTNNMSSCRLYTFLFYVDFAYLVSKTWFILLIMSLNSLQGEFKFNKY